MYTKKYAKTFGYKPELKTQTPVDDQVLGLGIMETYFIPLTMAEMEVEEQERLDQIDAVQNNDNSDLLAQLQAELAAIQSVCP